MSELWPPFLTSLLSLVPVLKSANTKTLNIFCLVKRQDNTEQNVSNQCKYKKVQNKTFKHCKI